MAFSTGQLANKLNNSLRRTNRRLFLDKENGYSLDSRDNKVNESFRKALEVENENYFKNKRKSFETDSFFKRCGIVFMLGILLFAGYQVLVLYNFV